MSKQNWIDEVQAMIKMGYSDRKYFRKLVEGGTLAISFRHSDNRRNWEYDLRAIEKIKSKNETIIYS